MHQPIEVCTFRSLDEMRPLSHAINTLNLASRRPCPFSTFEFMENYVLHDEFCAAGQEPGLVLLGAFEGGNLIGYLPLRRVTEHIMGLKRTKLECLVTHDNDRPHTVATLANEARCCDAFYVHLLQKERDWTFLELKQQDLGSRLYPLPTGVGEGDVYVRLFENVPNGTIHLRWKTLAEYHAALHKKFRGNLGRLGRKLFDAGRVEYLSSRGSAALEPMLDVYRSIEQRSWKAGVGGTITRHPVRDAWFRGLLAPNQPMAVEVNILTLDGVPISGLVNGTFGRDMYALQIAYDQAFHELAPGSMTLLLSLRHAIEGAFSSYNLLSSYTYYKERWLATTTPTHAVQLFRRRSLHHAHALAGDYKRQMGKARDAVATTMFNAIKRQALAASTAGQAPTLSPQASSSRREASALCVQLLNGELPVEHIGVEQLKAMMPFETHQTGQATPPPAVQTNRRPRREKNAQSVSSTNPTAGLLDASLTRALDAVHPNGFLDGSGLAGSGRPTPPSGLESLKE